VPLLLFGTPRAQTRLATLLTCVVLAYPALRSADLFPTGLLLDLSARVAQDRAHSLGQRFENEDMLVKKAGERALFGWGGFGRNRVYDAAGNDVSVTDGAWIATYGAGGAAGFICVFGLLTVPVFRAGRALRKLRVGPERLLLGTVSLLVAFVGIDLLPNGLFSALPLFLAGALGGAATGLAQATNSSAGTRMPASTRVARSLIGRQPSRRLAFEQSKKAAAVRPSHAR
jgi:hypothetical protein